MARYFLFVFLSIVCLTACDRSESTLIAGDEQMATHKYITPEENGDTTVIYIGSAKDLQNALTLTAERQVRRDYGKSNTKRKKNYKN